MAKYAVEERISWRRWVTPKCLHEKPIHRWFVFPHSFTSKLVHALIEEWGLNEQDRILDPFVGAGTTLLAAKERGIPATGYDLLPLSVFVSRVKVANYSPVRLDCIWNAMKSSINPDRWQMPSKEYPDLVKKALPERLLAAFEDIDSLIAKLACSDPERDFFRLALLAVMPKYSRAVATGGWLKWTDRSSEAEDLQATYSIFIERMLEDLHALKLPPQEHWHVRKADARCLPDRPDTYSAVITSPPYPNRHDYTRIFGVELMFCFSDWEETRRIRYQSVQSHPEARPVRPRADEYRRPSMLSGVIEEIKEKAGDPRIPSMLDGYFLDLYICLREARRVCKKGARIAFVVGNAQYYGLPVAVDEFAAELGEQAGLCCERIAAVRYRGNSAQQMKNYGRNPSRESIVIFRK
jgi:hypothetical protein